MADSEKSSEVLDVSHIRRNGFSCPWHPLQFAAWFFIFLIIVFHYGFMVFYIPGNWRVFGYIIPGLLLLVHVVTTIVTSSIDPAERSVRLKTHSASRLRPRFDRSKHEHVIENYYCNLCCVAVTEKAKHCRQCDKCVIGFDHHCKWLNNCVGSRNYRWFLATIISALAGSVLALITSVSLFILFFAARERLGYNCDLSNIATCNATLRIFSAPIPSPVFPTLTAALGVFSLAGVLLVGHLTLFHLYLIYKGLTTYEYFQLQPAKPESHDRRCCPLLQPKVNRVTPTQLDQGSNSSAGMANFDRTPSPASDAEAKEHNWGVASSHPEAPLIQAEEGSMGPRPSVQPSREEGSMGPHPSVQPSRDDHTQKPSALPGPEDHMMDMGGTLVTARSAGMGTGHNGRARMGIGHKVSGLAVDETGFMATQQTVPDHSLSLSEQADQSSKVSHVSLHLTLEENNSTSGPLLPHFPSVSSSQSQREQ